MGRRRTAGAIVLVAALTACGAASPTPDAEASRPAAQILKDTQAALAATGPMRVVYTSPSTGETTTVSIVDDLNARLVETQKGAGQPLLLIVESDAVISFWVGPGYAASPGALAALARFPAGQWYLSDQHLSDSLTTVLTTQGMSATLGATMAPLQKDVGHRDIGGVPCAVLTTTAGGTTTTLAVSTVPPHLPVELDTTTPAGTAQTIMFHTGSTAEITQPPQAIPHP